MKHYITIAALIAAGTTLANADEEYTINPLKDSGNWSHAAGNPDAGKKASFSLNSTDATTSTKVDKYYWKKANAEAYSTYQNFESISLDSADDYLKFSYNFKTSGVTSGCTLTLALVGTQSAIVTGFETSKANYATTDIVADSYTFTGSRWGKAVLDGTNLATIASGTLYHVEGDISWDETLSKFVLKLALDSIEVTQKIDPATGDLISSTITQTPRGSATVTLNNYIDINTLIVSSSAPTNKYSELQNIELTWGHIAIPEPSAFGLMAGLGALALAGTRRRRK